MISKQESKFVIMLSSTLLSNRWTEAIADFKSRKINLRQNFYQIKDELMSTQLFQFFDEMPKAVLNHVHFPAFLSTQILLEIVKMPVVVKDMEKGEYGVWPLDKPVPAGFRRWE